MPLVALELRVAMPMTAGSSPCCVLARCVTAVLHVAGRRDLTAVEEDNDGAALQL